MKKTKNSSTNQIESFYSKLPSLPKNIKSFLVQILPIAVVVIGGVGLLSSLKSLGQYTIYKPYIDLDQQTLTIGIIHAVLGVVSSVLFLYAFLSITKHRKSTWGILFFALLIAFAANLFNSDILGLILPFVGLYLLFQLKSYFK